jgi:hypothetical protein
VPRVSSGLVGRFEHIECDPTSTVSVGVAMVESHPAARLEVVELPPVALDTKHGAFVIKMGE